jgi:hypothetical protein
LRVVSLLPGLSNAFLAGLAGRKQLGGDAGFSVQISSGRCWVWPCVEFQLYAGRGASDLAGQICGVLLLFIFFVELQRLEPKAEMMEVAGISVFNKAPFLCRFEACGHGLEKVFSVHGVLEKCGLQALHRLAVDLQLWSSEAAPGSESTVALCWLLSNMVERRLLPHFSSASVLSSRRLKMKTNLQAAMPRWRPLRSSAVGSRCLAPSGSVPGGDVLGCAATRQCGGEGAGLDGFFRSTFRVLSAKRSGLVVTFHFLWVLCVNVVPLLNESF